MLAGLSLAGLLLPEAVAYATIAGLPPQAGVCALFAGLFCYAVLGASRFAVVSATSSSAAVLAVAAAALGPTNPAARILFCAGLVLVTGIFFLVAGFLRAGSISDFIAKPVLRGFAFGLAVVIITKQVANVVGVPSSGNGLPKLLWDLGASYATWHVPPLIVGTVACILLFVLGRVPRVPSAIVVVAAGIVAEAWFGLSKHGVPLVGQVDLSFAMAAPPAMAYGQWLRVGELSAALALILYAESYSAIRTFAMKHGDRAWPNRDLIALGAANLVSALFHGLPVGAGFSATATNESAGVQTKLGAVAAGVIVLAVVAFALPLIALLPSSVLAAIVIHAVSHTVRPGVFGPYFRWRRDRGVIVGSLLAVLLFGVLDGLLVGVAVSLLFLLRRLSESTVAVLGRLGGSHDFVSMYSHPEAHLIDGVIILRPEAALFFANADRILTLASHLIETQARAAHTVILSLEESPDLDGSTMEALATFTQALHSGGKRLYIARLKGPAHEVLLRSALPGLERSALLDLSVDDAVDLAKGGSST